MADRYEAVRVETVSTHGLLYTWQGSAQDLKPLLFMAHSDVGMEQSVVGSVTENPRSSLLANQLPYSGLILHSRVTTMESSSGEGGPRTTNPTLSLC